MTWVCLKEFEREVNFNEAPVKEAIGISFVRFKEERKRMRDVRKRETERKKRRRSRRQNENEERVFLFKRVQHYDVFIDAFVVCFPLFS